MLLGFSAQYLDQVTGGNDSTSSLPSFAVDVNTLVLDLALLYHLEALVDVWKGRWLVVNGGEPAAFNTMLGPFLGEYTLAYHALPGYHGSYLPPGYL